MRHSRRRRGGGRDQVVVIVPTALGHVLLLLSLQQADGCGVVDVARQHRSPVDAPRCLGRGHEGGEVEVRHVPLDLR